MDFSHPAQADFVAAVMQAAGIERATLVGHSMGGSVIGHVAQRHPERVAALVFVDGAVREASASASSGGSILGIPVQLGSLAEFPPFQRWGRIALLYGLTRERMAATQLTAYYRKEIVTPEVEEGYLQVQKIKDWDLALLGVLRDSSRSALAQPLSTITVPTLIIWGDKDTWVPLARGQALHTALPQSELIIIPNTGHLPMEEDVAAFNAALLEWLKR
ncbi:MAG: alpha/beta hydrolase [Anaerolineales bacterium]|nr:alpha/beta hydrolase [Anaerolineales bacterium]